MKKTVGIVIALALCFSIKAQILKPILTSTTHGATQVLALPIPVGQPSATAKFSNWNIVNAGTEAPTQIGSPVSGTITSVSCNAVTAPSGGTDVIVFRIAGVTVATCTVANGAHQGIVTGLAITLTEGALIDAEVTTMTTATMMSLLARVENVPAGVAVIPLGTIGTARASGSTVFFANIGSQTTSLGQTLPAPVNGTVSAMYLNSDQNAGAGQFFTLCDITSNSSCTAGSGAGIATCQYTSGQKQASCTGLTGTVTETHQLAGSVNNTAGVSATFSGYIKLVGVNANTSILPFTTLNGATVVVHSSSAFYVAGSVGTTETSVGIPSVVGGTAAGLYGSCLVASAGSGHGFTLYLNDASTTLTFLTGGTNRFGSDIAHTAAITRGQNISLQTANSNTTTDSSCAGFLKITGTT